MIEEQRQPLLATAKDDNASIHRNEYGTDRYEPQASARTSNDGGLTKTLCPSDSFEDTKYWADLNDVKRRKFARAQYRSELRKDWKQTREMFGQSPFSPLKAYFRNYVAAGAGFFAEGNVLFSVGNTMPLLKALWPECWLRKTVCDSQMIDAIKYMEILGVGCQESLFIC